jgi:hypothetical protein
VPSGNPPSAIAGGYCVIDGTVLMFVTALARLLPPPLPEPLPVAVRPTPAAEREARL